MNKPPFLECPTRWTHAPREARSNAQYATAFEAHVRRRERCVYCFILAVALVAAAIIIKFA